MKKILILMSDSGGGGHRASADALRDAISECYGAEVKVEMIDLWLDYTFPPLNQVPRGYRFLVDDAPWLYKLLYRVGEQPLAKEPLLRMASRLLSRPIGQVLRTSAPDLIMSVHPLMQAVPLRILRRTHRDIPFVTVVTDFIDVHPVWFDKHVTLCCVPSEAAYGLALKAGLQPEQVRVFGLPIRPAFAKPTLPKATLRESLGLQRDLPCVLLVSGGEGMGRLAEITQEVTAALASDGQVRGQMVVICGRNERLEQELVSHPWPIPMFAKGYVDNVWDWMAACDVVITKAGPGTIAEALAMGLPILLCGYIPGQESANVPYVLKHGAGVFAEDPKMVAQVVSSWLGAERAVMEQFAERSALLGRPQAAYQIVREAAGLMPGAERGAHVEG